MSEKEERILILRGNSHKLCRQLVGCIGTGNCAECKIGIPRSEAVERMAKAIYVDAWKRRTPLIRVTNWEYGFADNMKKKYRLAAEAALDALVGKNLSALDKLNKVN